MKIPVGCMIGEMGSGKSLYAVYLAVSYLKRHPEKRVFSNFKLYQNRYINDEKMSNTVEYKFSDLKNYPFPDWLENGLLIIDEIQEGAPAFDFMKSGARNIVRFISQIRKRGVELLMITPYFEFITLKLRTATNYIIAMDEMKEEGVVNAYYYSYSGQQNSKQRIFLKKISMDLSNYFQYYETDKIFEDDSELEGD